MTPATDTGEQAQNIEDSEDRANAQLDALEALGDELKSELGRLRENLLAIYQATLQSSEDHQSCPSCGGLNP